ncbi:hypothetical protein KVF89_01465 [Nocardioides carbamazepini]|uniref:hypothetical protein n=1 Tax=Nocardioides carbamazepini TaxID=2854259 RepID=UPI002149EB39|nr:hypothetical protein [Nocardioides carbamazepini]MCR1781190.1 hypothetical protein [Nocardioides carbamazepini]
MRHGATIGGLLLVMMLVAGCGDDGDAASGSDPTPSAATGAPSADGTDDGDGGDADDAVLPVFCDLVSADQLTAAVGAAMTTSTGPFDACEFEQEDPRALSGSLGAIDVEAGGGYEAYQSGSKGAMDEPTRHDLAGIGDAAYVDIGTVAGGGNLQVGGGALVGQVVYTLNLAQATGMSEEELVAVSERLLRLMVDAT